MNTRYGGGSRLKQARTKIGISQRALASELGLSPAYLSLIETERQPVSQPIAVAMEEKYHISAKWLWDGSGSMDGTRKTNNGKDKSRLRVARDELGLSQKGLAAELGISPMYLGLMERCEQPISQPVALKMEKLHGYSAEWILFEKGPKRISEIS